MLLKTHIQSQKNSLYKIALYHPSMYQQSILDFKCNIDIGILNIAQLDI